MASTDDPEVNERFARENGASFPILSDPTKAMPKSYDVLSPMGFAKRWTFYIDAEGIIRKIDRDVNPRTAGADLVVSLEALGVPRRE
jgi:peroxiredoxin Q/BCP